VLLEVAVLGGWGALAAAGLALARMWREESRADRIVGLLYHRVVPRERYETFTGTERIFSIPVERFVEQLGWLRDHGHHFVTLDQVADHLHAGAPLPDRPVLVTFDDGCESVYARALPVLKGQGVPAAVFVTCDAGSWIFHEGEYFERRMTPEEVRACHEAGITVGSHAVTHRGLDEMDTSEALGELRESRRILSQWSGAPVEHFAVPLNFYDRTTLRLCREAGFRTVCTSDNGTSNASTSPWRIKRFIVEGGWSLAAFERSLRPATIVQRRILSAAKKLPPKLLGERRWMPLRERIFASPLGRFLGFRHLRRALLALAALAALALLLATAAVLF
jgi:peptidoglycan/xylan/chitin deacetylase (PgdA/CDA1 family)